MRPEKKRFKLYGPDLIQREYYGINATERKMGIRYRWIRNLLNGRCRCLNGYSVSVWDNTARALDKVIGVYAIRRLSDGKAYYGCSSNLRERFRDHANSLNRGVHGNALLQEDWLSLGRDSFTFEVLQTFDDLNIASECELLTILGKGAGESSYNIALSQYCCSVDGLTVMVIGPDGKAQTVPRKDTLGQDAPYGKMAGYREVGSSSRMSYHNYNLMKSFRLTDGVRTIDCMGYGATARRLGVSRHGLMKLLSGKQHTHKGWMLSV